MAEARVQRRLAAILAADGAAIRFEWERRGRPTLAALKKLDSSLPTLRSKSTAPHVTTTGDGLWLSSPALSTRYVRGRRAFAL